MCFCVCKMAVSTQRSPTRWKAHNQLIRQGSTMSGRVSTKQHNRSQRSRCAAPSQPRQGARQGKPTESVKQLYDLPRGTFTSSKYTQLYTEAVLDRLMKGSGKSVKMNHLFRLWCVKLRDEFDTSAYLDFFRLAQEDQLAGSTYGMECLFRFFSYGLETDFQQGLYDDFERVVLEQFRLGGLYGLEKFWAFHAFKGFPPGSSMQMHPELAELITTRFTKLEDFKPGTACLSQARDATPSVLPSSLRRDVVLPDSLNSPEKASPTVSAASSAATLEHPRLRAAFVRPAPCGGQANPKQNKCGRQVPSLQKKVAGSATPSKDHSRPVRNNSDFHEADASKHSSTLSGAWKVRDSSPAWISSSWKERLNWQAPEYIPTGQALAPSRSLAARREVPASQDSVNKALAAAAALVRSLPTVSRRKGRDRSRLVHAAAGTAQSDHPDINLAKTMPHPRLENKSHALVDSTVASYTSDATILNSSTCIVNTGDVLHSMLASKLNSSNAAASSVDVVSVDGRSSACELEHSLIFCMDLDSDGDAPAALGTDKVPEATAGAQNTTSCCLP